MRAGGSLRGSADFRRLWFASAVSLTGDAVTAVALPMVAVFVLRASPFEIGLLAAAGWVPLLLFGLPAGVWMDRVRRRPVLVAADLGRALAVIVVPAAAAAGALELWLLYAVAVTTGTLSMLFRVGWSAYLPVVVGRERLVDGNSTLEATATVVGIAGAGLGGALVHMLTAPFALLVDAASYVVSAVSLASIRVREPEPARPSGRGPVAQLAEGLRFVRERSTLSLLVVLFAACGLVLAAQQALTVVFLARSVGLPPAAIGTLLAVSAAGGFAGAVVTPRLGRRFGPGRTLWVAIAVTFPFGLLVPLTGPGMGVAWYGAGAGVLAAGLAATNVVAFSFLLASCPSDLIGRVGSVTKVTQTAGVVAGGVLGGLLGELLGARNALWIVTSGLVAIAAFVVLSPLRRLRDLPAG